MNKLAVLFPGQGVQYVGMTHDIAQAYPNANHVFLRANEQLERDIRSLTFSGPEHALGLTENTQPCLFTSEMAIWQVLVDAGIQADAYLGFSLGEWSALAAAGVLDFSDAIRLVEQRGKAMQEAVPIGEGGMAVILGKSAEEVKTLCESVTGYVEPSNYNCPGQISVAGSMEGIRSLLAVAAEEKIVAKRIAVSIPSHCRMMEPAARIMKDVIRDIPFADPDHPIIMNCCAKPVSDRNEIKENLIRQLTSPVRMEESLNYLLDEGFTCFMEVGPGNTLTKFVQKCAKGRGLRVKAISVHDLNSFDLCKKILTEDN